MWARRKKKKKKWHFLFYTTTDLDKSDGFANMPETSEVTFNSQPAANSTPQSTQQAGRPVPALPAGRATSPPGRLRPGSGCPAYHGLSGIRSVSARTGR